MQASEIEKEGVFSRKPKVLIVAGYHPNETLAVQTGEILLRHNKYEHIKTVLYTKKADKQGSTCNLRRFIERFNPDISLVLHSDDNLETDALIFYRLRIGERIKAVEDLLLAFIHQYDKGPLIFFGISNLRGNPKRTIVDIELGSKMAIEKAVRLVKDFAQYLVDYN